MHIVACHYLYLVAYKTSEKKHFNENAEGCRDESLEKQCIACKLCAPPLLWFTIYLLL